MQTPVRFLLQDEDGNTFEGLEVLRLDINDGEFDHTVLVLKDNNGSLYPFELVDEDTLLMLKDKDLLKTVQDAIDLYLPNEEEE